MTGKNSTDGNLDAYLNFGPLLSHEEMTQFDKDASGRDGARRICLMTCTRSADMLRSLNAEFPEAFDELLANIEGFKEHAKRLLDIAETASLRMQIAGSVATD